MIRDAVAQFNEVGTVGKIDALEKLNLLLKKYAQELAQELYPEFASSYLASFVDWERYAEELFSTDYEYSDGHVYRNY